MFLKALQNSISWAIALGLMTILPMSTVEAALFEQEDVDPEKFVAIAVPLPQGGRYNLIVLEQKSDEQLCWQDSDEEGMIDPLLLSFDFSGICGRSTDSNGYSIRQVGEDLALKYRLSLQKKDDVLVLMGLPLQSSYGKPFEIGRTQILSDGFMEISLNPDWRLTRRVYQGQPLGHLYFTRDVIPPEPEEVEDSDALLAEDSEDLEDAIADAATSDASADEAATEDVDLAETDEDDTELASEDLDLNSIFAKAPDESEDSDSESSGVSLLQGPVQIPVPTLPTQNPLPDQSLLNAPTQIPVPTPDGDVPAAPLTPVPTPVADVPAAPLTPIPVPNIAPLGQVGASEPDVLVSGDAPTLPKLSAAGEPPPPPFNVALSIRRYRVFVDPKNDAESEAVKTLAPDSFWTSHKGQRLLQVGAFFKKEKADSLIQALGRQKINGIIDASQY